MKVLVTGGAGFIGSRVARALCAAGHDVRIVDRASTDGPPGAEMLEADLRDPGVADQAVAGVDAVDHHAARVGMGVDFTDAPGYVGDNDVVTAELLAALTRARFAGRVVLASSMVVYGEGRYRCPAHGVVAVCPRRASDLEVGRGEPTCPRCGRPLSWAVVSEEAPLDPRSVYAVTKVAQEHLCRVWAREVGATVVALRYHNVYGTAMPLDTPYAGVAAIFRSALRAGRAPQLFEDGRQTRDFVHVSDVARANLAALTADVAPGRFEPVNICSGRPVTIADIAAGLVDAFGADAPAPVITGRFRLGDVRHVVASPDKARDWLGFEASVELADGLAEMAAETQSQAEHRV